MSDIPSEAVDSVQPEADAPTTPSGPGTGQEESEEQVAPQAETEQPEEAETSIPEEADQAIEEPAEEPEEGELEVVRAELEQAQAQSAEYLDGWQRARAEFANYKKRVEAERMELKQTSNQQLLLKLLPVVDDFERAFQTLPEDLEDVPWVGGVKMVLRKLEAILESENVTPIEATGQPFDPLWHEAFMQEETSEYPDGYVSEEMQRGYRLGERVLRPSMVKVASNQKEKISENQELTSEEQKDNG